MVHDHQRAHEHPGNRKSLSLALIVTALWFIVELGAGFYTNSLALLADAGHMLTDLAALSLSLFALKIAERPATNEKTFGYLRAEILAALANGVFLVLVGLTIVYEAYQRILVPPSIRSIPMLVVSSIGLGANLLAAGILSRSDLGNLNLRGAFLHVLGDIVGSVGAICAGIIMVVWQWYPADAVVSFVVAALILFSSWRLLRDSVDVLLEGTPRHLDVATILADLGSIEGVRSVHDLHVWSITSGMPAMSCHVVLRRGSDAPAVLRSLSRLLRERHNIAHTTIQIETDQWVAADSLAKKPCGAGS
ncbi:MAG: cation transporter [Acidobacteria bacterium]|nr:cation transporter [Acidobacteriota bacterium]